MKNNTANPDTRKKKHEINFQTGNTKDAEEIA
jgi:hypothetical protein